MRARHRHWRIPSRGCAQIRRTRPSAPPGPRWRRAAPILPLVRVHHRREAPLMLGLPDRTQACLFDLDGVLTDTATVHAAAWKQMFDEFLRERARRDGRALRALRRRRGLRPRTSTASRATTACGFLASRGIELPEGNDDPPGAETVDGLGNRKNELVLELHPPSDGVEAYEGSVRFVEAARRRRPADGGRVVERATAESPAPPPGIADLFEARVDGVVAEREHLPASPPPTRSCRRAALGVDAGAGGGVRGRARRRRGRPRRRLRLRGRRRPRRPGRRAARARRRRRGDRTSPSCWRPP